MSFVTWSPLATASGLVVLAAGLFLLQRLRIRFSDRAVPTLLFWREAVRENRARVLVRRFRHPWAYVFLLLLASCLWLAASRPELRGRETSGAAVILVENSWATGGRSSRSRVEALLAETLGELGARPTRVLACGGRSKVLLAPGEPAALALDRWRDLRPESAHGMTAREVDRIVDEESGDQPLDVVVIGPTPLPAALHASLPDSVRVRRRWSGTEKDEVAALASLGYERAASGKPDTVDVSMVILGKGEAPRPDVRVGDAVLESEDLRVERVNGGWIFRIDDLTAAGQTVVVGLTGPAGRREARLQLPDGFRLPIQREGNLPFGLEAYLAADPDLEVGRHGLLVGRSEKAAFRVVDGSARVRIVYGARDDLESVRRVFEGLGWDEVWREGEGGDDELGRVDMEPGYARRIEVSASLFDRPWHFLDTEAFPLFMAAALRWLADSTAPPATATVGDPVGRPGDQLEGQDGKTVNGVGEPPVPLAAGRFGLGDGTAVEVSTLLPAEDFLPPSKSASAQRLAGGGGIDPTLWLGAAALAMLLAEWWFTAKGRMP